MSGRRAAFLCVGGVALAALLLAFLFQPAGGLRGRYAFIAADGREVMVHERIDARIDFPVPQRLDAAYIFHWDLARQGFPGSMPAYVIRWTGLLEVPRDGTYGFAVETQGECALRLDDAPMMIDPEALTERPLRAGLHRIALEYRLPQGEAKLVLKWRPPGAALGVISEDHLFPDPGAVVRGRARRSVGWVLLAGAALLAGGALRSARRRPHGRAGRLVHAIAAERSRIALGAILVLAAFLRFHDYALVPFHHETADEYQHAWEGWTLLHWGTPAAWSTFPSRYPPEQARDFQWFGDRYVLVWPYFDHPPLFSLPVGLLTSLKAWITQQTAPPVGGARFDFLLSALPVMRIVPILCSLAGVLLLVRLAKAYGASEEAALLAALVYATLPIIVLSHRLVKGENLLALLFMGAVLLAHRCGESGSRRDALLLGALCGLSLWTKATGVAVPAVALVMLASRRRWRAAGLALAVTAGFLLLYLAYAAAFDFRIFLGVLRSQATSKLVSLEALHDLLGGKVVVKLFGRGWYLWLLLCGALAGVRRERGLLLPLVVYALVIAATADSRVIYGWYRIPLYPFLCVAAGVALEEMIRAADLYRTFPFAVTAVVTGLLYALPESVAGTRRAVYLFALVALAPFLLRLAHERRWTQRLALGATLALVAIWLMTSLVVNQNLLEIYAGTRGAR
jgi:hypothetical protein